MLAFGRPRALLITAGIALVAAGVADDPSPAAGRGPAVAAPTSTARSSSTSATVPRPSTTATTAATTTSAAVDDDSTTTAQDDERASTTSTTRTTTTTSRRDRPAPTTTTTTSTSTTVATTAPPPCPGGEVVWTAELSAMSSGDDRWAVATSGTIRNSTGAAVEITSVTTSVSTSDGTAQVRGRPSPRQLGPGVQGSFAGNATVQSSTEPAYRSNAVVARWADESIRSRCPAPR